MWIKAVGASGQRNSKGIRINAQYRIVDVAGNSVPGAVAVLEVSHYPKYAGARVAWAKYPVVLVSSSDSKKKQTSFTYTGWTPYTPSPFIRMRVVSVTKPGMVLITDKSSNMDVGWSW